MKTYILLFLTSCLLTFLLTPLLLLLCKRYQLLDRPDRQRKIHTEPIPRLGGLAIFLTFNLVLSLLFLWENSVTSVFRLHLGDVAYILIPSTLVFLVGLLDDIRALPAKAKFVLQIAAAVVLYFSGFKISIVSNLFGEPIVLGIFALPITVLWIVGITNAFNLIDGMDGLASGIAFFVSASVFTVSLAQGNVLVSIISVITAGATLGFLRYNFNPAKIFMGDSGSYFLGFVLGALAIQGSQKSSMIVSVSMPILILGLPIIDTVLSIARRFLEGKPIFAPDQQHIHHKLLRIVRSQRFVVLILYGITALLSFFSLLIAIAGDRLVVFISLGMGLLAVWGIKKLGYEEFEELGIYVSRAIKFQRRVISNQIFIRKMSNEIENAKTIDEALHITREALSKLNFDRAEIKITSLNGRTSNQYYWSWSQNGKNHFFDSMWEIYIPLNGKEGFKGELKLLRSLKKEGLPFQVSSIVDTFAVKLNRILAAFSEEEVERFFQLLKTESKIAGRAG